MSLPLWEMSLVGLILLLGALVSMKNRDFLSLPNLKDMSVNACYVALAGLGASLVILTGQIDISIGSGLAVCAALAGQLSTQGWGPAGILLATMGMGVVLGGVNGVLTAYGQIPPILATLATMSILRGVLLLLAGGRWISLSQEFHDFGLSILSPVPLPALAALGLTFLLWLFLSRTAMGRFVYAVGGNPEAAARVGIPVARVKALAFVFSGLFLGLAGFVYVLPFSTVQTNAGMGFELLVITGVVVGGVNIFGGSGSVWGALLGGILLTEISTSLTFLEISTFWEKALQGGLVLVAVAINTVTRRGRNP